MRKGADVLSKWVGESERQLRLLFEEASKRQPSIIFFDEIDGLAPVRSSKSDQIHNSRSRRFYHSWMVWIIAVALLFLEQQIE